MVSILVSIGTTLFAVMVVVIFGWSFFKRRGIARKICAVVLLLVWLGFAAWDINNKLADYSSDKREVKIPNVETEAELMPSHPGAKLASLTTATKAIRADKKQSIINTAPQIKDMLPNNIDTGQHPFVEMTSGTNSPMLIVNRAKKIGDADTFTARFNLHTKGAEDAYDPIDRFIYLYRSNGVLYGIAPTVRNYYSRTVNHDANHADEPIGMLTNIQQVLDYTFFIKNDVPKDAFYLCLQVRYKDVNQKSYAPYRGVFKGTSNQFGGKLSPPTGKELNDVKAFLSAHNLW
jgi:hypothetical protein